MRRAVGFIAFVFSAIAAFSQGVHADFSIPAQVCMDQRVVPTNNSSNATRYEWDLCQGDLSLTPTASLVTTLGGSITAGTDIVFDGTNWFGFVASQNTNSILRLDFGTDILSTPTITDLGNVSGNTNLPTDVKIVNDNGNWYGFVYSINDPIISRINFGTSLSNTTSSSSPITADVVLTGPGSVNGGFDMMNDGSQWVIVLTYSATITVARLPSITGTPAAADIKSFIIDPYASTLGDIVLQKSDGLYYGYVVSYNNKTLQRLTFGPNLFSTPTFTDISVSFFSSLTPYGIDIGQDAGEYFLFIATLEGTTLRLNLGSDLSTINVSATSLGNFSTVESTVKIRLIKHQTSWLAFAPSWSSTRLYRILFANPACHSNVASVLTTTEPSVSFPVSGTKFITLRAFDNHSWFSEETNSIAITGDQSPQIDFSVNGICTAGSSVFTSQSPDNIQSYNWDFGDASSAATASPTHVYSTPGVFTAELEVSGSNGCVNSVSRDVTIYDQPSADFTVPSGLVCTNNEFTFTNTTNDVFDGNLTYQWFVNNVSVAATRDLKFPFSVQGDNEVRLIASIPGCFSDVSHTVANVQSGPTVSFTSSGVCNGKAVSFNNSSTGSITGYAWAFGDGKTSTAVNPQNIFDLAGTYNVSLDVTASNGCVSTSVHPLVIYTTPAAAFSLDLPPFSCTGTPSQFHDATASMPDSNIQSWSWTFGDTGSGTGKNPLHTYTNAGPYTVRLSVITDRGCSNSIDQQVNIVQSPNAMFNYDATCANKATHFTDASTGGVVSWQWKVGSALYNTQNPTHTFSASGNYNVQLVATGQNNCTASLTRQIIVPVVPTLDFQVTNPCSDQVSVFNDITTNPTDPIVQHNWSFNGIGTAAGQQAPYTFNNGGTFPVQLTVQALSGCSYSITKQVTVRTSPVASFTMSDQSGPPPLHVAFTNTSTGAATYNWSLGDGSSPSTNVSLEHTFASLGDYDVTLVATSAEGCSKTMSKVVSVITPVNELALEDFLLKQGAGSSYQGYVQVRNNGNYRVTSFIVNYEIGGGIILSETVPSDISIGDVKTYTLATRFNQPLQSSFVCAELNDDTDIDNNKACATLSSDPVIFNVGPNPADAYINVESVHSSSDEVRVRIYDTSGGVGYDKTFDVSKGLSRLSLDTQNLSPGIYVIVVSTGRTQASQRLLIVR
jgi:PKD repeat protein